MNFIAYSAALFKAVPPACIRRHIHPDAVIIHRHHRNPNAAVQGAQLFQLLRLFQRRHRNLTSRNNVSRR
jgi:hypothetical protein